MPATVPHAALAQPPRWLSSAQLHPGPTAALSDWLFDQGSLTRRLTALAEQQFSVVPLEEGWQPLRHDECLALGVPSGRRWT